MGTMYPIRAGQARAVPDPGLFPRGSGKARQGAKNQRLGRDRWVGRERARSYTQRRLRVFRVLPN
jgi:hypothetical protein